MLWFTNAPARRDGGRPGDEPLSDVLAVDGVRGARRFQAADDLAGALQHPYTFLTGYDVSSGESAEVAQRLTELPLVTGEADRGDRRWWFEELSPRVTTDDAGVGPFDHMIVLTNPQQGSEAEFNRWYDEVHIPDVLNKIGGFVGAHRFRRAEIGLDQNCPWQNLAIYDIPAGMITHAFERLQWSRLEREQAFAVGRQPQVPVSPVMAETRLAWFYRRRASDVDGPAQESADVR